jgi:hypothetical protein
MERSARIAAAVFVFLGGLVHLQLWSSGYRVIPYIGPWFVANAMVSALLTVVVLVRPARAVVIAGIALSAASLAALVMSRTVGIFGFTERAWTDQAVRAVASELGAIAAFAVLVVASRPQRAQLLAVPAASGRARRA